MAVGFGFSVGDFIAVIGLLRTSYYALRSAGGAKEEYQRNMEWLEQLVTTLQKLKDEGGHDVPQLSESCKKPLDDFKLKVRAKYDKYFGTASQAGKITVAINSIRWTFAKDASKDLVVLRNAIGPQLTLINLNVSLQQSRSNIRIETTLNNFATETKLASDNASARLDNIIGSVEHVKSDTAALCTSSATLQASTNQVTTQLDQLALTLESTKSSSEAQERVIRDFRLDTSARSDELSTHLGEIDKSMDTRLATIQSDLQGVIFESSASRNAIQQAATTISERDQYLEAALKPWIRDCVKEATMAVISEFTPNINAGTQTSIKSATITGPSPWSQKNPPVSRFPRTTARNSWSNSWFIGLGTLTITAKRSSRINSETIIFEIAFRPLLWSNARTRALAVFLYKNAYGPTRIEWQPRAYNVVSDDAPIIQACHKLDFDLIKELFKSGAASPFDMDSQGFGLASRVTYSGLVASWDLYFELRKDLNIWRAHCTEVMSACIDILEFLADCGVDCGGKICYDESHRPVKALDYIALWWLRPHFIKHLGQVENVLVRLCRVFCERSCTQPFEFFPIYKLLCSADLDNTTSYIIKGQSRWPLDVAGSSPGQLSSEKFSTNESWSQFDALTMMVTSLQGGLEQGGMYWFDEKLSLLFALDFQRMVPSLSNPNYPNPPTIDQSLALHDKFFRMWLSSARPSTEQLKVVSLYAKGHNLLPNWERVLGESGYTQDMESIRWKWTKKISKREKYFASFLKTSSFPMMPGSFPEDDETNNTT